MGKLKINYNKAFTTKYSRDYYRGTSFHYCGKWDVGQHYTCDEFNVDFVVCNQALFVCTKSHVSSEKNKPDEKYIVRDEGGNIIGINSVYWDFVMSGLGAGIEIFEYLIRTGRILSRAQTEELIANVEFDVEHLGINFEQAIHNLDRDVTDRYTSAINITANEIRSEVAHDVDDLNGTISRNRSEMLQTAEAITNTVEAYKSELDGTISENYSVLDQRADSISATVAANKIDAEGKINTVQANLTLAADQISTRVSEVEDDVTTKYSEIIQTTDSITSTVAANKQETDEAIGNLDTELSSQIQQTAEAITAEVSARTTSEGQIISDYNTKITQTAAAITSEASARQAAIDGVQTDYNSKFEQTAQAITSEVTARQTAIDNVERDYNSKIEQTAQDISAEVSARETAIDGVQADYNAKIDINAQAITSEVSARQTADNEIQTDYNSKITQTAEAIESEVTARQSADNALSADYNSKITQTATQIRSEVNEHVETLEGEIDSTNSALTQTAGEIRAEVANTKTDLEGQISTAKAEIKVTTDAITNTVESYKEELDGTIENNYSVLEQRADSISSTVVANKEDADGKINTVQSNLTQTAVEIRSQVTANKNDADGKFTTVNATLTQHADQIASKVSQDTYNTDKQSINSRFSAIEQDAQGIHQSVTAIDGKIDETAEEFASTLAGAVSDLQDQIDGAVETYRGEVAPTLSNYPTSDWAVADYEKHIGDMYYDTVTGYAYRFTEISGNYSWDVIRDSGITEAIAKANDKGKIFIDTPYTPYKVGDLWVQGHKDNNDGTIYRCITTRETGQYSAADWGPACDFETTKVSRANLDILSNAIVGQVAAITYNPDGTISSQSSSAIQQTAGNIRLSVANGAINTAVAADGTIANKMLGTGIDITNGLIVLTGDKVKIQSNSGTQYALFTINDAGIPLIKADYIEASRINIGSSQVSGLGPFATRTSDLNYSEITNTPDLSIYALETDIPKNVSDLIDGADVLKTSSVTVSNATTADGLIKRTITVGNKSFTEVEGGDFVLTQIGIGDPNAESGGSKKYFKVDSDGLLTAKNAIVYGTIYASAGKFSGEVTASKLIIGNDAPVSGLKASNVSDLGGLATKNKVDATNPSEVSGLATVATSGNYNDLDDKPTIPDTSNLANKNEFAQKLGYADYSDLVAKAAAGSTIIDGGHIRTSLIETSAIMIGSSQVTGLKSVATTGDYDDLTNKPTIPDVSNLADKDTFAQKLGYANYNALVTAASNDQTMISGGYLRTSLIDVDNLSVKHLNGADGSFTGSISVNDRFIVNSNGDVTANTITLKSGTLGGDTGNFDFGSTTSGNRKAATTVSWLKAGDITGFSDTTNSGVYIGTDGINIGGKFKVDDAGNITATGLKITSSNIDGKLSADKVTHQSLAGYMETSTYITDGFIKTGLIKANELEVSAAKIQGTLTASQIDATGLSITSGQISDKTSMLSSYTKKSDISYLTSGWTQISGGMVLSSLIKLGYTSEYLMIYGREDDYYVATDRVVDYDVLSNFVYYECPECQGDPDRFIDEWDLTDIDNLEMFLYDNHFDYEYADSDFKCTGGINGRIDTSKYGKGIAGWFGGEMLDRYYSSNTDANNAARIVFRHDGSGYLGSNKIRWDAGGNTTFEGDVYTNSGKIGSLNIFENGLRIYTQEDYGEFEFEISDSKIRLGTVDQTGTGLRFFNVDGSPHSTEAICSIETQSDVTGLYVSCNHQGNHPAISVGDGDVSVRYGIDAWSISLYDHQSTTSNPDTVVICPPGSDGIAFTCSNGMFAGLRPKVRYITNTSDVSGNGILSNTDHTIIINNTAPSTLKLPSLPKEGQEYLIMHISSTSVTILPQNNKRLWRIGQDNYETSWAKTTKGNILIVWSSSYNYWVVKEF